MFNEFVQFFVDLFSNMTIFKFLVLLMIEFLMLAQCCLLYAFVSGGKKK